MDIYCKQADGTVQFETPRTLYRGSGDYIGLACSEPDPYEPTASVVYWVSIDGGPLTADVMRAPFDTMADGDAWLYDRPTGLTLTAIDVASRIDE